MDTTKRTQADLGNTDSSKDEILTLEEALRLVKVGRTTLLAEATAGRLGAFKVGRQWRFRRAELIGGAR